MSALAIPARREPLVSARGESADNARMVRPLAAASITVAATHALLGLPGVDPTPRSTTSG